MRDRLVVNDDSLLDRFEDRATVGYEILVVGADLLVALGPEILATDPEVILRIGDQRVHEPVDAQPDLGLDVVDHGLQESTLTRAFGSSLPFLKCSPPNRLVEVQHESPQQIAV